MNKVKLIFKNVSEIVGSKEVGLLILSDEEGNRQIAIPCDKNMIYQFSLRLSEIPIKETLLPEVLAHFLEQTNMQYEILINDIVDGKYRTMLINMTTLESTPLRASDAILLSYISSIPIYIEKGLMEKQSVTYENFSKGISIPVNSLNLEMLEEAIKNAVKEEKYEIASFLRDEINRRKNNQ